MTSPIIEPLILDRSVASGPLHDSTTVAAPTGLVGEFDEFVWIDRCPNLLRRPLSAVAWVMRLLFGIITLLALLTIAAAVPILNFFALGYLLEIEGHVARTGKLRRALPLLPAALRIGSIFIGAMLCLLPVVLLAGFAADARWIAPHGTATWIWNGALALTATAAAVHLVLALSRGGNLSGFVRPIKNVRWLRQQIRSGDYWPRADRLLQEFFAALRPRHHFWLGVRGFFGSWVWLALPTALYGTWWYSGSTWLRVVTLVVGACFVPVLAWVPFLQVRLAAENRWSAMFEIRHIRELFRHAPLSWLIATAAFYALSIPLFVYSLNFRMHAPFRVGIWWDLTFISIACTIPARIGLGWAYHRAVLHGPARIGWIWLTRIILTGSLGLYVWLLFHTPITHETAPWQLEHHALVLPIPL